MHFQGMLYRTVIDDITSENNDSRNIGEFGYYRVTFTQGNIYMRQI